MIRMLQEEVVFYDLKGNTGTEIGRLMLDGAEAPSNRGKLATMKRKTARWRAKVVLCLPSDSVLQCQVSLPLAVQENLREVVGFEMERFTAFRADEVYYSCRLMHVDRAEKRIAVRLIAVFHARSSRTWSSIAWRPTGDSAAPSSSRPAASTEA